MPEKAPAKRGRPSDYSIDVAAKICEKLACGKPLVAICVADDMPHVSTVFRWLGDPRYADFRDMYARAREAQADYLADETIEIADNAQNDWMEARESEQGEGWKLNGEHVQRSKLRIDTRRWFASKIAPRKYGEAVKLQGDPDAPLHTKVDLSSLSETQLDALMAISKAATRGPGGTG